MPSEVRARGERTADTTRHARRSAPAGSVGHFCSRAAVSNDARLRSVVLTVEARRDFRARARPRRIGEMKLDFSVLDAPVRASDKLEAEWCVPDPRG